MDIAPHRVWPFTVCLCAAAEDDRKHSINAEQFAGRHFYVDGELAADPSLEEAIEDLARSQEMLAESDLKLNRIASNCLSSS